LSHHAQPIEVSAAKALVSESNGLESSSEVGVSGSLHLVYSGHFLNVPNLADSLKSDSSKLSESEEVSAASEKLVSAEFSKASDSLKSDSTESLNSAEPVNSLESSQIVHVSESQQSHTTQSLQLSDLRESGNSSERTQSLHVECLSAVCTLYLALVTQIASSANTSEALEVGCLAYDDGSELPDS
jgi:hypothetical protein